MQSENSREDFKAMAEASKLLATKKSVILARWAEKARTLLPAARHQSKPALYNALPIFIEEIVQSLAPADPKNLPSKEVGREHGEQRSNLVEYSLRQIIEEYSILQDTIYDSLEQEIVLHSKARRIIHQSIMSGITEAASEYARIHDSIREQFIAIITHDLRNPLSAAKTSTQMIHRVTDKPEKVDQLASRAVSSINRVEAMLKDLLDTFQIRAGKPLPINTQPNDLKKVAQEAVDELTTVHGARFIFLSPSSVPATFCSDGIRRSIENLANNAVKYGDALKPVTIEISSSSPDEIEVSVHNHGNPLISEDQAKLFKPFHRAPFAETSGKLGWGLGLTLVQGVVQAHGGQVTVSSEPDKGTTFTLHLPKNGAKKDQAD